jgi:hypothetical protein
VASSLVFRIVFDSRGDAYAATNNGLFRMSAHSDLWTAVLQPAGPVDNPPYDQQVTDVAIQPGSGGGVGALLMFAPDRGSTVGAVPLSG